MADAPTSKASDTECALCDGAPDDWCPACGRLLCEAHSEGHVGSFDLPCIQDGIMLKVVPSWCGTFSDVSLGAADGETTTHAVPTHREQP